MNRHSVTMATNLPLFFTRKKSPKMSIFDQFVISNEHMDRSDLIDYTVRVDLCHKHI